LSDVIAAIKSHFGEDIPGPASRIQLKDQKGTAVKELNRIDKQYYLDDNDAESLTVNRFKCITRRVASLVGLSFTYSKCS
jgi:hypothetical protein